MPQAEAMLASKQTEFFQNSRMKGVPTLKMPVKAVEPSAEKERLAVANNLRLPITKIIDYAFQEPTLPFDSSVCKRTGIEEQGHLKSWKKVYIPCLEKK